MEPYASYLLRRFRAGESVAQLVASEEIPTDRIAVRLLAAERFERAQKGGLHNRDQRTRPQAA